MYKSLQVLLRLPITETMNIHNPSLQGKKKGEIISDNLATGPCASMGHFGN